MLHFPRLVSWTSVYTKQAQKDTRKIAASNLKPQALRLLEILAVNPFQNPPPYEKLVGDLEGAYSRRINIQHRLVYQVHEKSGRLKCCACGRITSERFRRRLTFSSTPFPAPRSTGTSARVRG